MYFSNPQICRSVLLAVRSLLFLVSCFSLSSRLVLFVSNISITRTFTHTRAVCQNCTQNHDYVLKKKQFIHWLYVWTELSNLLCYKCEATHKKRFSCWMLLIFLFPFSCVDSDVVFLLHSTVSSLLVSVLFNTQNSSFAIWIKLVNFMLFRNKINFPCEILFTIN